MTAKAKKKKKPAPAPVPAMFLPPGLLALTVGEVMAIHDALNGKSYAASRHAKGWDSAMRKFETLAGRLR